MKISYISGVCVKNDAISNAIREEIAALRASGIEDVRLYAYACHYEEIPFSRVNTLAEIAFDGHFQLSDVAVFHFGIYNPLFNVLPIVSRRAKRLVIFHNITPKEFVPTENHPLIDKSFRQVSNITWADHVICDSETNLAVLRSFGICIPASVLPIAVQVPATPPPVKPSFADGILRIVFIGRFVRSKGPLDLLAALERVIESSPVRHLRLDMVGNLVFSDQNIVADIQQEAQRFEREYGQRIQIRIHGDAEEETKQWLLQEADLFVLPTYHEGFCVPIVEAMASGCKVIAYDNSNTPAISGGLAALTPTGDVAQLALAMKDCLKRLRSLEWQGAGVGSYAEYAILAREHVQQFAPQRVSEDFVRFVKSFAGNRA